MYQIFQKEIDEQGRVILPREWRQELKTKKIIIIMEDRVLKVLAEPQQLSSFFDKGRKSTLKANPFENYDECLAEASLP